MLKIYNTLTRDKSPFTPLVPGQVKLYVCGMTVYDDCHIGHARSGVAFDVVQRWLRASGYAVTFVRNITDIDDKIIKRATENGESIGQLTSRYTARMHEDFDALGIQRPDIEPRATQYIPQMLGLIEQLEHKGLAYRTDDGDVNFSVRKFTGYGKLSGKSLEQLRAGERVAVDGGKQDPLDFVLWKHAKANEPAEAKWDSHFGTGRPGWHIECSAMACQELGESFDIHGGGADLQFPHHENEIAQSEGASGKNFAQVWMHNGFVNVDNEKMSKSLGNFFTIRDVLEVLGKRYEISREKTAEVLRFFLLRTHYRSPITYADTLIDDARNALNRFYTALWQVETDNELLDWSEDYAKRFRAAMDDDFNTPIAVSVLFDLVTELNKAKSGEIDKTYAPQLARQLKKLAEILGFGQRLDWLKEVSRDASFSVEWVSIQNMIEARTAAKKAKNFAEADRIRADLLQQGIALEDSASGTTWRRA